MLQPEVQKETVLQEEPPANIRNISRPCSPSSHPVFSNIVKMAVAMALSGAMTVSTPAEAKTHPKKAPSSGHASPESRDTELHQLINNPFVRNKLSNSTVILDIRGQIQKGFQDHISCTGFILDDHTLITADHCMDENKRLWKIYGHGYVPKYRYVASLKRDVVMIQFEVPFFSPELALNLSKWGPKPGEALIAAGRHSFRQLALSTGRFVRAEGEAYYFINNIMVKQGESGGPVVNRRAEVVGILARGNSRSRAYAAPVYPALVSSMRERLASTKLIDPFDQ